MSLLRIIYIYIYVFQHHEAQQTISQLKPAHHGHHSQAWATIYQTQLTQ